MKATFASKVRAAIAAIGRGGKPWTIRELAVDRLDLVSDKEKRPLYAALREMERRGEIARVSPGVYRRRAAGGRRPPELQEVMWRLLRNRRTVTVEDLVELTSPGDGKPGASADYAREWLSMLVKRGVVKKKAGGEGKPSAWTLAEEPAEMPRNDEKAERLRQMRIERRRAAVARANAHLDAAYRSIVQARIEINGIEE